MRAVILAAGRGTRLTAAIGDRPKCLARIGGCTLLERQIRTLQNQGLHPITVVAGYMADQVAAGLPPGVEIVRNPDFGTTNSLYSLWLARERLLDGFVVLNGDVLFHPQLLADLLTARYEDALLVAARRDAPAYSDEEMKVTIRRGIITAIAKTLDDAESDAENVGVAKFGAVGARHLVHELDRNVVDGRVKEWLPRAFGAFSRSRPLHAIDVRGYPWIEIDFPEDYWRACGEVLPALADADDPAAALGRQAHSQHAADIGRTRSHV